VTYVKIDNTYGPFDCGVGLFFSI